MTQPGLDNGCAWCSSKNCFVVLCYPCEKLGLEVTTRGLTEIETPTGFGHPFASKLAPQIAGTVCSRCGADGDVRLCAICESSLYPRPHV
jgi:hypothetical protein